MWRLLAFLLILTQVVYAQPAILKADDVHRQEGPKEWMSKTPAEYHIPSRPDCVLDVAART